MDLKKKREATFLRLLFNHYHSGQIDALLKILPHDLADAIKAISIESANILSFLKPIQNQLSNFHYSWLVPTIETIDPCKQALLLAFLPETLRKKLQEQLKLKPLLIDLTPLGKRFFSSKVSQLLETEFTLPKEYLAETELTFLAGLNKEKLVQVIDFLGLYDLAEELQQIVDKRRLEKIYKAFSIKQQRFLKKCLLQKEKLVTKRIKLEQWGDDLQKLKKILHQRGIIRLAYALSGESQELLWHVSHILDIGRGKMLSSYSSKKPIPAVTETLRKQIVDLKKFLEDIPS